MNNVDIEKFTKIIPRDIEGNKKFRKKLNILCEKDIKCRNLVLDFCKHSPRGMFDLFYWAFNPEEKPDRKILPFILRKKQIEAVNTLDWCIENQHDLGVEKSRKQGATELVKELVRKCIFTENRFFIVGSLKKEDVDNRPDTTTIFAKIDNAVQWLPKWFDVDVERKDMVIHFKRTNSIIKGETTNENFSVSKRADAVFLDEFGREPQKLAELIEGSVRDVSGCIIYNSTHWLGTGHPFNIAINRETTKKITLMWYENENQMQGAYTSPSDNIVELIDLSYYEKNYPKLLKYAI